MSYYSDKSENPFASDPHAKWSQPRRSPGPLIAGAIIGVLVLAGIGVIVSLNQPDKLPPPEVELAEEKFREAAAAFDSTTLGTEDEEVARIHKLFRELRKAFQAADGDRLVELFDVERMLKEVERKGMLPSISSREMRAMVRGARIGLARSLAQNAGFYTFERFDLKRCKFNDDFPEALVYTRMWDADGYGMKMRWWLRKNGDRWQVYDFEELTASMRASNLIGAIVGAADMNNLKMQRMQKTVAKLQNLAVATNAEDFEQLDSELKQLPDFEVRQLPNEFQAMVWMYRGINHMANERNEKALRAFEKADALHSDMPLTRYLKSLVLSTLERYEEAELYAREYLDQLGSDADGYWALGDALFYQEKVDEAADAYRKSLDDDPDYVDSLIGLSIALPDDMKAEVGQRFEKMRRPGEHFVVVCEELVALEDHASMQAVIAAYRKMGTDDPELSYYDAWLKFQNERYAEAAATVQPAIARVEDAENREFFVDLYFDSMLEDGKGAEAYANAPDPEYAMDYLGGELFAREAFNELKKLLETHRTNKPNSPLLDYYTGELALEEENWDQAADAYLAGLKKVTDPTQVEDFRFSAVYAMFMANRIMEAYREIKPRREVFGQLVKLISNSTESEPDEKQAASQLQALIDEHKQADPSDPALPDATTTLSWLKRDYESVVNVLGASAMLDSVLEDWLLTDRLVNSLIRLKRFDQAFDIATRHRKANDNEPWYPTIVKAAQGDVAATARWLEKCDDYGYILEDYYDDEVLAAALRSSGFERLQKKYLEPRTDDMSPPSDPTPCPPPLKETM